VKKGVALIKEYSYFLLEMQKGNMKVQEEFAHYEL